MSAVAPLKVTWMSEEHSLCTVGAVEVMVRDLVLKTLALEIARVVSRLLEAGTGAAAELQ